MTTCRHKTFSFFSAAISMITRSHFLAELQRQALLSAWLKTVANSDDRTRVLWRQQGMWLCGSGKFAAKCLDCKKGGHSVQLLLEVLQCISSSSSIFFLFLISSWWKKFKAKRMWVRLCLTWSWFISLFLKKCHQFLFLFSVQTQWEVKLDLRATSELAS